MDPPLPSRSYLGEDLGLDPSAGLVLTVLAPRGAQRVDLVDEDRARGVRPRHVEQAPHHALALAPAHTQVEKHHIRLSVTSSLLDSFCCDVLPAVNGRSQNDREEHERERA